MSALIKVSGEWSEEQWLRRPRKRRGVVAHEKGCGLSVCGGVMRCRVCKRLVGWCKGTSEQTPRCCACWWRAERRRSKERR